MPNTPTLAVIHGKPTTTTRQVAAFFKKRHDRVLRALETLDCSQEFRLLNFGEASYEAQQPNGGTATYKEYTLTKNGFAFLCMGFTGKDAAKWKEAYITEFERMEAVLTRKVPAPRLTRTNEELNKTKELLLNYMQGNRFSVTINEYGGIHLQPIDNCAYNLPASRWGDVIRTPSEVSTRDVINIMSACAETLAKRENSRPLLQKM